jgi:hypothetical protein
MLTVLLPPSSDVAVRRKKVFNKLFNNGVAYLTVNLSSTIGTHWVPVVILRTEIGDNGFKLTVRLIDAYNENKIDLPQHLSENKNLDYVCWCVRTQSDTYTCADRAVYFLTEIKRQITMDKNSLLNVTKHSCSVIMAKFNIQTSRTLRSNLLLSQQSSVTNNNRGPVASQTHSCPPPSLASSPGLSVCLV